MGQGPFLVILARLRGYTIVARQQLFAEGHNKSEGDEQLLLFRWARKQSLTIPHLAMLFHIPNGGQRDARSAARLKLEGVEPGVPDICLPVPTATDSGDSTGLWHGLWIELKREGGRTTPEQNKWLRRLFRQGYMATVCYGAEQARAAIVDYLGLHGDPHLLTLDLDLS